MSNQMSNQMDNQISNQMSNQMSNQNLFSFPRPGNLNANQRIVISNPERVQHYEFDQLPEGALVDHQGRFAFPNLQTVICTNVLLNRFSGIESLVKLETLQSLHLFIGGVREIRRLYVPSSLEENEVRTLGQRWLDVFEFIFRVFRSIPRDADDQILEEFAGRQYFVQGIEISRLTSTFDLDHPIALAEKSMIQLHILHREHLAPSFPHCTSLLFDRPFLFKLAPALTGALDFRSTYSYVKELHIALTCLVPKLLLKLPGLRTPVQQSDLSQALIRLHPVPANQLQLRSTRQPRGAAEEFADIEEANQFVRRPSNQKIIQFRTAVLNHLRTEESELNENAESWVLKFIANFHLAYLNLSYNGLSLSFYNRLAQMSDLTATVNKLVLFEEEYNAITDTRFLLAFTQLYLFKTNLFDRPSLNEQPFIDVLFQSLKHGGQCELHLTGPPDVAIIKKYRRRSHSQGGLKKTRFDVQARGRLKKKLRLKTLKDALTKVSQNLPL